MDKYKKNLVRVLARIQNCWTHDDDGSDLIKSKISHLFCLVFSDLEKAIIGDENDTFLHPSLLDGELEEIANLLEKDYSFTKFIEKVEQAEAKKDDEIEALETKIKGLEGSIEHWYKPWERDARAALELLEKYNICSYCGLQNVMCGCPYG